MKITLQVQIRTDSGVRILDYSDVVKKAEWITNRFDSPGKLTFDCQERADIAITEGSSVVLAVDGVKIFKGYVFTAERRPAGETTYTAYDQLRYLKANASYTFENMTLKQIIEQIAGDFELETGTLEETGYAFPCLLKENESCLDIIFDALAETIIQTGKIYLFYDDAGMLVLTEAKNLYVRNVLGDKSLVTDYTYRRDIDSETYNRVKLARKNETSGRTDIYIHEDTDNIKKWGLLQYYDEIDEALNEAQADEMCRQYLQYYNRVLQTLTLEAIGVIGVRAGSIVPVRIQELGDLFVTRLLLVEKVTHTFESDTHEMSIEVKSFEQIGGVSSG